MSWQSDRKAILDAIDAMTPDEARAFARDCALENRRKSYLLATMTNYTGETFGLLEWAKLDAGFVLTACSSGDDVALGRVLLDGMEKLYGVTSSGTVRRAGVGAALDPTPPDLAGHNIALHRVGTIVGVGDEDGHPTVTLDTGDGGPVTVRVSRDEARAWAVRLGERVAVTLRTVRPDPEASP